MFIFPVIYVFFFYVCTVAAGDFSVWSRSRRGVVGGWGYTEHNGPHTWGGICQTGKKQSPINIELGSAILRDFSPLLFSEDYLTKHKFLAKNNGHTIYIALEDDSIKPYIYGACLGDKFIFEQLHLHWESEHEFDGKRADLEMHLVHYNAKYGSFAEAASQPNGIAVLAVVYNENNYTVSHTDEFFDYILDVSARDGHIPIPENSIQTRQNPEGPEIFALRHLLPRDVSKFFRYEGSLTTPGCGEVVQWTIFISRLTVSSSALEAFRTLRDHDGNELYENFRPPQDLNDRKVYLCFRNKADESSNNLEQMTQTGSSTNAKSILVCFCCLFIKFFGFSNFH